MLPGVFLQTKTGNNVLYTDDWFEDLKSQVEAYKQENKKQIEELKAEVERSKQKSQTEKDELLKQLDAVSKATDRAKLLDEIKELKQQVDELRRERQRERIEELQQQLKTVESGGSKRDSTPKDNQTLEYDKALEDDDESDDEPADDFELTDNTPRETLVKQIQRLERELKGNPNDKEKKRYRNELVGALIRVYKKFQIPEDQRSKDNRDNENLRYAVVGLANDDYENWKEDVRSFIDFGTWSAPSLKKPRIPAVLKENNSAAFDWYTNNKNGLAVFNRMMEDFDKMKLQVTPAQRVQVIKGEIEHLKKTLEKAALKKAADDAYYQKVDKLVEKLGRVYNDWLQYWRALFNGLDDAPESERIRWSKPSNRTLLELLAQTKGKIRELDALKDSAGNSKESDSKTKKTTPLDSWWNEIAIPQSMTTEELMGLYYVIKKNQLEKSQDIKDKAASILEKLAFKLRIPYKNGFLDTLDFVEPKMPHEWAKDLNIPDYKDMTYELNMEINTVLEKAVDGKYEEVYNTWKNVWRAAYRNSQEKEGLVKSEQLYNGRDKLQKTLTDEQINAYDAFVDRWGVKQSTAPLLWLIFNDARLIGILDTVMI